MFPKDKKIFVECNESKIQNYVTNIEIRLRGGFGSEGI